MEATARALFVHPNTVRYRLRQTDDLTGYSASDPRHALTLRMALALGRQSGRQRAARLNSGVTVFCRVPTKNGPTVM